MCERRITDRLRLGERAVETEALAAPGIKFRESPYKSTDFLLVLFGDWQFACIWIPWYVQTICRQCSRRPGGDVRCKNLLLT